MLNSLRYFIAGRYIRSRNSHSMINHISRVSIVAMAMPVAAIIVLLAVFNGLESKVRALYNAIDADITISAAEGTTFIIDSARLEALRQMEGIESLSLTLEQGAMAAVLSLADDVIERVCNEVDGVVVAANYNCPGQLVISGASEAVSEACTKLKEAGARRALRLPVGGAFHSPLMEPARQELEEAIAEAQFMTPTCPVYQNVTGLPSTDPQEIKANLLSQLTSSVKGTQSVKNMLEDGAGHFIELGPGQVLQGLVSKIGGKEVITEGHQNL